MEFVHAFLDKDAPEPLYYQLYLKLSQDISGGVLPAGEKLPGKRSAAAQLGVSVNTVNEAYQMLAAEGYVDVRERSGFVVNALQRQLAPPALREVSRASDDKAEKTQIGEKQGENSGVDTNITENGAVWRHSFSTGGIDTSLFPLKTYTRILREVTAADASLFERGNAAGDYALRAAIAVYLRGYRGANCAAQSIVVGAGLEVLLGMLARLLSGGVAVEDPGYPKTARIFENAGAAVHRIAVDRGGMAPERLAASGAKAACITPSHQFPTGCVMPVGRRLALLEWAENGGVIIEDDYDSEFRFDGRPLPCMQGLDKAGRVVYAGTFSRSLAPGIRAAYLVLPPHLLQKWQVAYGGYTCTVSRPEQHTLARMLDEGHFARSLNRMRLAYRTRRNLLLEALKAQNTGRAHTLANTHTGLFLLLRAEGVPAAEAAKRARANGLRLHALSEYAVEEKNMPPRFRDGQTDALVLGYGGLVEAEIEAAVEELFRVL